MSTQETFILDPKKTTVIVVDMQNAFLRDEGSMAQAGLDISYLKQTVKPVRRLVDSCHQIGVPLIFTKYVIRQDYMDAGVVAEHIPGLQEAGALMAGSWDIEVDERLGANNNDIFLDKNRYCSFYNTNLETLLRGLKTETLVVCGVTTEICVESTIRSAFFRDYKVVLVQDAVAATNLERHEGTLRTVGFGFGRLATVTEVIKAFSSS